MHFAISVFQRPVLARVSAMPPVRRAVGPVSVSAPHLDRAQRFRPSVGSSFTCQEICGAAIF